MVYVLIELTVHQRKVLILFAQTEEGLSNGILKVPLAK